MYYDKHGVKFPSLVDPNYATKFGAVPKTFFIDEHGVVKGYPRGTRGVERYLQANNKIRPVTDKIRSQWSKPGGRLESKAVAALAVKNKAAPKDLQVAVQLASRYLDLQRIKEAKMVLETATKSLDPKTVALGKDTAKTQLLGEAYFQLCRASKGDRKAQVQHATMAFYLKPSLGYAKQIARIIAPEKFDTKSGRFDNRFRESTARRLYRERQQWLQGGS